MSRPDPAEFLKAAAAAGVTLTDARGDPVAAVDAPPGRPKLVAAAFVAPATWTFPILTVSESNHRDWKRRSGRTQNARRVVSLQIAAQVDYYAPLVHHYRAGRLVRVTLARLAPHRLDAANLGGALKATEDAVALMLGCDDGDPRWLAAFAQEVQPLMGVRLTLEAL